jgi:hypothetical protein
MKTAAIYKIGRKILYNHPTTSEFKEVNYNNDNVPQ